LKTAVLYHVRGVPSKREPARKPPEPPIGTALRDIAASFQEACIDVVTTKLKRALAQTGGRSVIVGGGVSANRGLRAALSTFDVPVHFPLPQYCTDNAAMTAGLGHVLLEQGDVASLDLDAITYSQFAV
jgi:N6-L-threonylcarbamoyladenine synthase